jgi:tRNA(Ile)-lysidine synthase
MNDPLAAVARAPETALLVAFSGGLDSTVLLHALSANAAVRARGLRALHVQHDLQDAAGDWAGHCERVCADWRIPITVARVQVPRDSGLGLEGAARDARHAAFAAALAPGETLVLAHHRDDQAETVLLRLLRASGSDGLAAMREERVFGPARLWRPLLDCPRASLHGYAQAHRLQWLEDPSNADTRHDRNFLRHRALPLLRERWPEAEAALARSATLLAEDAQLLAEEARRRLQPALGADPYTLLTAPLLALSPPWRARVLRQWFASLGLPSPPGRAFARIDTELLASRHDAQPEYRWAGLRLQRWRDLLHVEADGATGTDGFSCQWNGASRLQLPGGGSLELLAAAGAAALPDGLAPLRIGARQGGERIRLRGRSHSHALKDCLLQAGLPPWLRRRVPLLHAPDDELLAAGDAVLSERWQRAAEASGLVLRWQP